MIRDGTQERTLTPPELPDDTEWQEARAREGWDERDDHWAEWMNDRYADASSEIREIVVTALAAAKCCPMALERNEPEIASAVKKLRDRFVEDCAIYYGDYGSPEADPDRQHDERGS